MISDRSLETGLLQREVISRFKGKSFVFLHIWLEEWRYVLKPRGRVVGLELGDRGPTVRSDPCAPAKSVGIDWRILNWVSPLLLLVYHEELKHWSYPTWISFLGLTCPLLDNRNSPRRVVVIFGSKIWRQIFKPQKVNLIKLNHRKSDMTAYGQFYPSQADFSSNNHQFYLDQYQSGLTNWPSFYYQYNYDSCKAHLKMIYYYCVT